MLSRMKFWATSIYVGITFGDNHPKFPSKPWTDLLYRVLLASDDQQELEPETFVNVGGRQHGLTMLIDFASQPSLRPEAFIRVHIVPGLPITLPTDRNGKFKLSAVIPPRSNKPAWSESILSSLRPDSEKKKILGFRLSVELDPNDRKEIVLTARSPRSQITIIMKNIDVAHLARCLIPRHRCKCNKRASEVPVPNDTWRQVTIEALLKMAPQAPEFRITQDELLPDIFIDASTSANATILAIGMLDQIDLVKIAWDCLICSLEKLDSRKRLRQNSSRALIIPHGFENRIQSHDTLVPNPIPL